MANKPRMKSSFLSIILALLLISVSYFSVFSAVADPTKPIVETKYAEKQGENILLNGKIIDLGVEECDFIWIWFEYKKIDSKRPVIILFLLLWFLSILGIFSPDGDSDGGSGGSDDSGDVHETIHMMLRSDRSDFRWPIEEELDPGTYQFRACAKNVAGLTGYGEWKKFEVS